VTTTIHSLKTEQTIARSLTLIVQK